MCSQARVSTSLLRPHQLTIHGLLGTTRQADICALTVLTDALAHDMLTHAPERTPEF